MLEAVDRSGAACAVLAADPRHAIALIDPRQPYSDRAEAALDRVLDQPRLALVTRGDDPEAIGAVVNLAVAAAAHGGTAADAAAPALARLVVTFPGEVSGAGSGVRFPSLRTALGEALAAGTGTTAGVDLVAAARQAGDGFAERLSGGDWNPQIDTAFDAAANDRFAAALRLGAGDSIAAELARQAGESDMVSLASQLGATSTRVAASTPTTRRSAPSVGS